jgi:S-DNA-T family DNA segregation ATPase FtsK/SpoIIIE
MGVSVRTGPVRWHGTGALLGWLTGRLLVVVGVLIYVAVCRPRAAVVVAGLLAGAWLLLAHPVGVLAGVVACVHALEVWAHVHPASWRRRGVLRAVGWWRWLTVYRRLWRRAVHAAELGREDPDGRLLLPQLVRVQCLERVDVLHVRGLLGQRFGMWEDAAPMLAHAFGAVDYRLHRGDDRRLTLELVRGRRGRSWLRDGRLELEDAV